jgi:8-oxo-dGTP diphosphatase
MSEARDPLLAPAIDLSALQAHAEAEGRHCVTGALIFDQEGGRVFVHRRGWDRRLLPGCWDIVGGHLESGETLLETLEREILEETGWQLTGSPQLAYIADWEASTGGAPVGRREFDFVVSVEGDLRRPRLEFPKHVEWRWLGTGDLPLLDENRGRDDGMVRRLVDVALTYARPCELRRPHLTAFLDFGVSTPIEAVRTMWDPAMAAQIRAHVTVAYPAELDSFDAGTARRLTAELSPFRLRFGGVERDGDWVFIAVDDIDGGWADLRQRLLPPCATVVQPHVTLVHPRTTNRGPVAWAAISATEFDAECVVEDVALTAFSHGRWQTTDRLAIGS